MDDGVRPDLGEGLVYRVLVEHVQHDRFGSQIAQPLRLHFGAGTADHLVTAVEQLWDESPADRTCCPCDEDPHVSSFRLSTPETRAIGGV